MRRLLSWLQQWFVSIDDTFSNARCSMDVVVFSHPSILGGRFLVSSSGWSCKALHMLVWAFLVLRPLLLVWSCVKRGLLCWVFWALLSCHNILSSFASTWPFSETLLPSFCQSNPSWSLTDCCCYPLEKCSLFMLVIPILTAITTSMP